MVRSDLVILERAKGLDKEIRSRRRREWVRRSQGKGVKPDQALVPSAAEWTELECPNLSKFPEFPPGRPPLSSNHLVPPHPQVLR